MVSTTSGLFFKTRVTLSTLFFLHKDRFNRSQKSLMICYGFICLFSLTWFKTVSTENRESRRQSIKPIKPQADTIIIRSSFSFFFMSIANYRGSWVWVWVKVVGIQKISPPPQKKLEK